MVQGAVTEDASSPNPTDTARSRSTTSDSIDVTTAPVSAPMQGKPCGAFLTASVTDTAYGRGDGTVTWNYSVANSATQYLASA
jgi:hypothetical protein